MTGGEGEGAIERCAQCGIDHAPPHSHQHPSSARCRTLAHPSGGSCMLATPCPVASPHCQTTASAGAGGCAPRHTRHAGAPVLVRLCVVFRMNHAQVTRRPQLPQHPFVHAPHCQPLAHQRWRTARRVNFPSPPPAHSRHHCSAGASLPQHLRRPVNDNGYGGIANMSTAVRANVLG